MSDGSSYSSHARSLFGLVLPFGGLFVMALSIGTGSLTVFWVGSALVMSAVVFHGVKSAVPWRRRRAPGGGARAVNASGVDVGDAEFVTWLSTRPGDEARTPSAGKSGEDELGSYLYELFRPPGRAQSVVVQASPSATPGQAALTGGQAEVEVTGQPSLPAVPPFVLPEFASLGLPEFELDVSEWGVSPGELALIQGVGVSLLVSDLPRSLEFYRDILGFAELDSGGGVSILAAGEAKLLLRQTDDTRSEGPRLSSVNLEVGDVDAVYEELRAKGICFSQRPRAVVGTALMEVRSVLFRDPDGHGLALTSWRPR